MNESGTENITMNGVAKLSYRATITKYIRTIAANKANPNVEYHFYAVAGLVGLVMGGLQAMSRSTYSRLLPENSMDNTTFFSFYDVLEKIAIMMGTLIFSFIIDKYDVIKNCFAQVDIVLPSAAGMRFAAFFMGVFFFVGLVLIRFVKLRVMEEKEIL